MDYSHLPIVDAYAVTCAKYYHQNKGIDPELLPKLFAEKNFRRLENPPMAANFDTAEAIGLGRIPCPWCKWNDPKRGKSSRKLLLAMEGNITGIQIRRDFPCRCHMYEKMYSRWSGPNAMVPKDYQRFRLGVLTASPLSRLSEDDQKAVIREINLDPCRNFLFVGPAGTSKTVFTTALFSHALHDWADLAWRRENSTEAVWRVVVGDYLKQEMEYERQRELKITDGDGNESYVKPKEPIVTRRKIREAVAAGLVPRLFLEEIDAIPNITKNRLSNLFGIINEVYEQGGQLVVNSNMKIDELLELFGPVKGEALLRRFQADGIDARGKTFDFYEGYELKK
jgi:hypothetical protein